MNFEQREIKVLQWPEVTWKPMSAELKIKEHILIEVNYPIDLELSIEENWDNAREHDEFCDTIADLINYEFREGQLETDIKCNYSRHYESKSVATQLWDGTWVGWTYWYGGGKHGEPEAIDWMNESYFLKIKERKMVEVLVFEKE